MDAIWGLFDQALNNQSERPFNPFRKAFITITNSIVLSNSVNLIQALDRIARCTTEMPQELSLKFDTHAQHYAGIIQIYNKHQALGEVEIHLSLHVRKFSGQISWPYPSVCHQCMGKPQLPLSVLDLDIP